MMYSESRKLYVIQEVLKMRNEALLREIESLLKRKSVKQQEEKSQPPKKPSDYAGCISPEEARNLLKEVKQSRNEWERDI